MIKDGPPKPKEEHSETRFGVFLCVCSRWGGRGRERCRGEIEIEIGIPECLSLSLVVLPVIILFADLEVFPKLHIRILFDLY